MHNVHTVILGIPYPLRVGFFSLNFKKKIGFSFDNLASFFFREETGITEDLNKWIEKNGKDHFFAETVYTAAMSYSMQRQKKFKINKEKFMLGLAQIKEADSKALIKAWQNSTTVGHKNPPGKKKAVQNR